MIRQPKFDVNDDVVIDCHKFFFTDVSPWKVAEMGDMLYRIDGVRIRHQDLVCIRDGKWIKSCLDDLSYLMKLYLSAKVFPDKKFLAPTQMCYRASLLDVTDMLKMPNVVLYGNTFFTPVPYNVFNWLHEDIVLKMSIKLLNGVTILSTDSPASGYRPLLNTLNNHPEFQCFDNGFQETDILQVDTSKPVFVNMADRQVSDEVLDFLYSITDVPVIIRVNPFSIDCTQDTILDFHESEDGKLNVCSAKYVDRLKSI